MGDGDGYTFVRGESTFCLRLLLMFYTWWTTWSMCHTMVWLFLTLALFAITSGLHTDAPWQTELQRFLFDNGHRQIDIIANSSTDWLKLNSSEVFFRKIPLASLEVAERNSFGLFVFTSQKDDIGSYMANICPRKVRSSLLVFSHAEDLSLLEEHLNRMSTESFSYLALRSNNYTRISVSLWKRFVNIRPEFHLLA